MPQGIWIVSKHTGLKDWAPWNAATNKSAQDNRPECNHGPDKADIHTNISSGEMAYRLQFPKTNLGTRESIHQSCITNLKLVSA